MINKWHNILSLTKFDKAWHENDLAAELAEFHDENNFLLKWSELSDVVYTCSRGNWSGHQIEFPFSRFRYFLGTIYMIPKYTGRWLFFRSAGKKAGSQQQVREVRNPKKDHKLQTIAVQYGIDSHIFQKVCERKLKYWLLLP